MQARSLKGKVQIGTEITVTNSKYPGKKAKLLYIGEIDDQVGQWVGLQLLGAQKGNHSGFLKGKTYFSTSVPDKGIFVRAKDITLPNGKKMNELIQSGSSPQQKTTPKPNQTTTSKFAGSKKQTKAQQKLTKTQSSTTASKTADKGEKTTTKTVASKPVAKKREQLKTQLDNAEQTQKLQQKIQELQKEIKVMKQQPIHKIKQQNEALMAKIKDIEQQNHNLKMTIERTSNQVSTEKQSKLSQLNDQIAFYKKSKDDNDREKKKFQARIAQLQLELDEHAENQQLILNLNNKIERLETKNQTLRTELESAKTQIKNSQSTGGEESKSESQYIQQINVLNQTVVLLESSEKQYKEKIDLLTKEAEENATKISDAKTTEKKLKQKERQNAQLKESLEEQADAVNFVEQLSLTKLRIQQELKAAKEKINDLLNEKDLNQQVQLEQQQICRQLQHEITERDIQIQQSNQRVRDKDTQIIEKVKQINQYKDRIAQLLKLAEQNNNLNKMKTQRQTLQVSGQQMQTSTVMKSNTHVMDMMKFAESINQRFIQHQNDNILIRNKAGVFLMNLFQALPPEFVQQFYPEAVDMLVTVKTVKDKSFYLFDWICSQLRQKNELYSYQNTDLTNWMLTLLNRLQRTYYNLQRIDLLISNCENQQQLGNIMTHRGIRDQSIALDAEITDLTNKFADNSISFSYTFDRLDHSNERLQSQCAGFNKTMSKDNETRLDLSRSIMDALTAAYTLILNYRLISELKQNAQIDAGFDSCLKRLKDYLRQICLNNHFRYKPKMKGLIDDMVLLKQTFSQIQADDTIINEIQNLASEHQAIKILKQSVLSSQSSTKQLIADLNEIQLTDELQKIQGKLEGNVWNSKLVSMKEQLLKVRQLSEQKSALEFDLVEHKKKILVQEKQIKDKSVVKDVLEKRIAQLQLKCEQVTVLNNTKQRLEAKLKSVEENNKIMEEEIENLIKKKSIIEQENKKIKESPAAENPQRQHRASLKHMASLPYSFNSAPVQTLLKQNSNLRNADLKEKVSSLKFSNVMKFKKQGAVDRKKPIRKQFLQTIVNLKILSPFDQKVSNPELQLQKLYLQLDKINMQSQAKREVKLVEVGTVRLWGGSSEAAGNTISVLGYSEMKNVLPDLVK